MPSTIELSKIVKLGGQSRCNRVTRLCSQLPQICIKGNCVTTMGWRSRVQERLSTLPTRTLLVTSRESGIELVGTTVRLNSLPTIVLWFNPEAGAQESLSSIVQSIAGGLGTGLGRDLVTFDEAIKALREYQAHIGPVGLILGWPEYALEYCHSLALALDSESRLLVISGSEVGKLSEFQLTSVDPDFLRLTAEEAVDEAANRIGIGAALQALEDCGGNYQEFCMRVYATQRHASAEPSQRATAASPPAHSSAPSLIIDSLLGRGMWVQALEWACMSAPERLLEVVDRAGDALFNLGEHAYFLGRLDALPNDVRNHADILFWRFAAACAIGQHSTLMPEVVRVLEKDAAPRLRAIAALAVPSKDTLSETSKALSALESPVTLRSHGYALGFHGDRETPLLMFEEAMRLADLAGADHLVVACGIDIAQMELTRGRYFESQGWARWALSEVDRRRVRDLPRRLSAIATLAFASILVGDLGTAQESLAEASVGDIVAGVPGLELLTSSKGDLHFLLDEYDAAEKLYRAQFNEAPRGFAAHTAVDLICLALAQGKILEAEKLAGIAYALSRTGSHQEEALGLLTRGIVLSWKASSAAEEVLSEAHRKLAMIGQAFHVARAAIWIAISRLNLRDVAGARSILLQNRQFLHALGHTGWKLLAANHPRLEELRGLYEASTNHIQLRLLGSRYMQTQDGQFQLSMRNSEILALLAANPSGLTAEKLHALQYGDAGDANRTKVAVSRLRKQLPISASPYRLETLFDADFIQVLSNLESGNVQDALDLYKGPLLADSDAPEVVRLRWHIEESLKQAVLRSGDPDAMIELGTLLEDDIEIWLAVRAILPQADFRQAAVTARIRRIRAEWNSP